ncbi:MAG: RsmD family RNA methyltransferase [Muribaculaceae bacterium]|nr:RsmD family RNA methyltransferase [Muribaculaceae bacterium]
MRIIRGKYGRRRFDVPTNITARPTTDMARENIFNVLENFIDFDGIDALDLFAGTGAVSFEFASRGCHTVTSVEKAATQFQFIKKVQGILHADNMTLVRGDVFKFISQCTRSFDVIFADPPYDLPQLPELPELILKSSLVKPDSLVIVEHSKANDFSHLPQFFQHRVYGKVNFTLFRIPTENGE